MQNHSENSCLSVGKTISFIVPMIRLAVFAVGVAIGVHSADAQDHDPKKFEEGIRAIEKKIADGTSRPGDVLFIGSSSIRLWDVSKSFPGRRINNHGFGGSHVSDSVYFFDRVVTPVKPSLIVLYAGDNDIANKKTPETVVRDVEAFLKLVEEQCPNCQGVLFIAVKPSPKRWELRDAQKQANTAVQKLSDGHKRLRYVDIWDAMLGDDGQPRRELFVDDGLHMTEAGYKIWTEVVEKELNRLAPLP